MNLRFAYSAAAVVVIMGGAASLAHAQLRDGGLLPPDRHGPITVAGCMVKGGDVGGVDPEHYTLARLTIGLDSVPEATCTVDPGSNALKINRAKEAGIDDSLLGRWVEVSGELEKEMSDNPNNLRELKAHSFRMVPVIAPRAAAAPAPYRPAPPIVEPQAIAPPPEPAPVATSGESPKMPKTASPVPAIGLLGLLALAGALVVRSFRLRQPD